MRGLTPKRLRLIRFIQAYTTKHGYAPTLRECAEEAGVTNATIHGHLDALVHYGQIRRTPHYSRSIEIVDPEKTETPLEAVRSQCRLLRAERDVWKAFYLAGCSEGDKREIVKAVRERVRQKTIGRNIREVTESD